MKQFILPSVDASLWKVVSVCSLVVSGVSWGAMIYLSRAVYYLDESSGIHVHILIV